MQRRRQRSAPEVPISSTTSELPNHRTKSKTTTTAASQEKMLLAVTSSTSSKKVGRNRIVVTIASGCVLVLAASALFAMTNVSGTATITTRLLRNSGRAAISQHVSPPTKDVAIAVLFTSPLVTAPLKSKLVLGRKRAENKKGADGAEEKLPWKYESLSPDSIDAAAVLRRSADKVRTQESSNSSSGHRYNITYLALVTPDVDAKWLRVIEEVGYKIRRVEVPIKSSDILNPTLASAINRDGRLGINEMAKIEPFLFSEYERVLMVDSDVMFHRNFDALFGDDGFVNENGADENDRAPAFQWTVGGKATEPINGGFLLMNPKAKDAAKHRNAILDIVREGDHDPSTGWKNSGIGKGTFGGMTIQGLLPYYFLHVLNGTASREIDRCKYNNMVQIQRCRDYPVEEITSNHFTGGCTKPWQCFEGKTRGLKVDILEPGSIHPTCTRFKEAWLAEWKEFAEEAGAPNTLCGTFVSKHLYSKLK